MADLPEDADDSPVPLEAGRVPAGSVQTMLQFRQWFKDADANGNGILEQDELAQAFGYNKPLNYKPTPKSEKEIEAENYALNSIMESATNNYVGGKRTAKNAEQKAEQEYDFVPTKAAAGASGGADSKTANSGGADSTKAGVSGGTDSSKTGVSGGAADYGASKVEGATTTTTVTETAMDNLLKSRRDGRLLSALDHNRNGKIDKEEFEEWAWDYAVDLGLYNETLSKLQERQAEKIIDNQVENTQRQVEQTRALERQLRAMQDRLGGEDEFDDGPGYRGPRAPGIDYADGPDAYPDSPGYRRPPGFKPGKPGMRKSPSRDVTKSAPGHKKRRSRGKSHSGKSGCKCSCSCKSKSSK